jgi:hypothetical protein
MDQNETLIIENLGPIKKLEIKPRPLTIIIGEQASGKSLVAQLLYFFRGLKSHLASIYNSELTRPENWHALAIKRLLDDLRGVPFDNFAAGIASLHYSTEFWDIPGVRWNVKVEAKNGFVNPDKRLISALTDWVELWEKDKEALGRAEGRQIFIPTERSMVTRLLDTQPQVLFAPYQPLPLRQFANTLAKYLSLTRRSRNQPRV